MLLCLVLTTALMAMSLLLQAYFPGTLLAVTVYKAHLMALGGWGGYWLDRALFPYARPDSYTGFGPEWEGVEIRGSGGKPLNADDLSYFQRVVSKDYREMFATATLRRAIVVAACLVCVGLGA
jgi:hypothetical protein